MAKSHLRHLLIAAAVLAALALSADAGSQDSAWLKPSTCRGSIAECMTEGGLDGEFEMDSETNRRVLSAARRAYIGYGALVRNQTPCSRKGNSYYNCRPGAVNPYQRSCTAATRCRSGL